MNVIQYANNLLRKCNNSLGNYFLSTLALGELAPDDINEALDKTAHHNAIQNEIINNLALVSQNVSPIQRSHVHNFIRSPNVHLELKNGTLLSKLAGTNLPKQYLPKVRMYSNQMTTQTASKVLHDYAYRNIAYHNGTVENPNSISNTKIAQRYQPILNQGFKIANSLSSVDLNYMQQKLVIYRHHPRLWKAFRTGDRSNLLNDDISSESHLNNIQNGEITSSDDIRKIMVMPQVSVAGKTKIDNFLSQVPYSLIKHGILNHTISYAQSRNNQYPVNNQTTNFEKMYMNSSAEYKQCLSYLANASPNNLFQMQQIFGRNVSNQNMSADTKNKRNYYQELLTGRNDLGQQISSPVTNQQSQYIQSLITNPVLENNLNNGIFKDEVSYIKNGNPSVNLGIKKGLPISHLTKHQQIKQLSKDMNFYNKLTSQSKKYMKQSIRLYSLNPTSFERQYVSYVIQDKNTLKALSPYERQNWQNLNDISQGIKNVNGQRMKTGHPAQQKMEVNYLLSRPQNRTLLRNNSLHQALESNIRINNHLQDEIPLAKKLHSKYPQIQPSDESYINKLSHPVKLHQKINNNGQQQRKLHRKVVPHRRIH